MELVDLGHRGRVIGGRSTTYALRVNPREQTEVCDPQRRAYSSEHYRREDWAGVHDCALGEELGSSGYVLDPLQERWNALQSSGILGVVGSCQASCRMKVSNQAACLAASGSLS